MFKYLMKLRNVWMRFLIIDPLEKEAKFFCFLKTNRVVYLPFVSCLNHTIRAIMIGKWKKKLNKIYVIWKSHWAIVHRWENRKTYKQQIENMVPLVWQFSYSWKKSLIAYQLTDGFILEVVEGGILRKPKNGVGHLKSPSTYIYIYI